MRTASLVLGIIGGVCGIIAGLLGMMFGGLGMATEQAGAGGITRRAFLAVFVAIMGIVGGAVALRYPKAAAILQLIACVVGFILAGLFWIFSGLLFLLGAALAFFGRRTGPVRVE